MTTPKPRSDLVPLQQAAADLARIYARLDECENIDEALGEAFTEALVEKGKIVSAAVDRNYYRISSLQRGMWQAHNEREKWTSREKTLKATIAVAESRVMDAIKPYPDLDFTEFRIQKNGGVAPMNLKFTTDERTVRNVITGGQVETYAIPQKYIKVNNFLSLDTVAIRKDLEDGVAVGFAKFDEKGEHLRY